jgi:hypothetical protein
MTGLGLFRDWRTVVMTPALSHAAVRRLANGLR